MKFRCDHCGADSPLDRDSLVVQEGVELPHIKCQVCGKMSVFGGGQIFTGDRPPPAPVPAPATVAPVAEPPPGRSLVLWAAAIGALLVAVAALVVAGIAASRVSAMKWNKADVSQLGEQEAAHERRAHEQAHVVLGAAELTRVGVMPMFVAAPTVRRDAEGLAVEGVFYNALAVAVAEVELRFVDATGKQVMARAKVDGVIEPGKSGTWRVAFPGMKDERMSVYVAVDAKLQFR